MEQLKKSDNLQRVTSRYKRRAVTFYAGELSRCELISLYQTLSTAAVICRYYVKALEFYVMFCLFH